MTMQYQELINQRKSTRTFRKRKLSQKRLAALTDYFPQAKKLIPELDTDILLMDNSICNKLEGSAGYCGFMVSAPHYLLILSEPHAYALENAGYLGADLLLKLTELEANTCWITLGDGKKTRSALELDTQKEPVALIAFGYERSDPNDRRLDIKSMSDVTVIDRKGYEAPKIKLDELVKGEHGSKPANWNDKLAHKLQDACHSVSLAPSYLNRQPYRLILDQSLVMLALLKDDMTHPEDARLNAGIAMLFFDATLRQKHSMVGWNMGCPLPEYSLPQGWQVVSWYDCTARENTAGDSATEPCTV